MPWIDFPEVSLKGTKSVKCAKGCGRTLKRTMKVFQTLNPFNRHPDGRVKTAADIRAELPEKLEHWKKTPEVCIHCQ